VRLVGKEFSADTDSSKVSSKCGATCGKMGSRRRKVHQGKKGLPLRREGSRENRDEESL